MDSDMSVRKCLTHTHLPIKACRHSDDVTSLVVNGKHVGGGALGILGKDFISQHPVGSFWIILVHCCHRHHEGSCREAHSKSAHICQGRNDVIQKLLCVCVCVGTRLGSLGDGAIKDAVSELWSVVVLVDDINDDVDGVLHLIPIQVHCVGSQLYTDTQTCTHILLLQTGEDGNKLLPSTETNYESLAL